MTITLSQNLLLGHRDYLLAHGMDINHTQRFGCFTPRCSNNLVALVGIYHILDMQRSSKETQGDANSGTQSVINKMLAIPANSVCAECGAKDPAWASVKLGTHPCLEELLLLTNHPRDIRMQ